MKRKDEGNDNNVNFKIIMQREAINRKQIIRWQHVSQLKANSFGSW
jgi:hypothetical protein